MSGNKYTFIDFMKQVETTPPEKLAELIPQQTEQTRNRAFFKLILEGAFEKAAIFHNHGANLGIVREFATTQEQEEKINHYGRWKNRVNIKSSARSRLNKKILRTVDNIFDASILVALAIVSEITLWNAGSAKPPQTADHPLPADVTVRSLTYGEKHFIRGIFGNTVNLDSVKNDFSKLANAKSWLNPKVAAVSPSSGQEIFFTRHTPHSSDYSMEGYFLRGSFAHEVTHILQVQNQTVHLKPCSTYRYKLDKYSAFDDFCVEQQAAVIEDYVSRFHTKEPRTPYRQTSYGYIERITGKFNPEADAHLMRVVEMKFPVAKETRLSYDRAQATHGETPTSPPPIAAYVRGGIGLAKAGS